MSSESSPASGWGVRHGLGGVGGAGPAGATPLAGTTPETAGSVGPAGVTPLAFTADAGERWGVSPKMSEASVIARSARALPPDAGLVLTEMM